MQVREAFERAATGFERTVAQLKGADWDRPTVCEVPVRELVHHVVSGNYFAVRLLDGAPTDEALLGLGQVIESDPVSAIVTSCAAQTDAFDHADRSRRVHHPAGEVDYGTFVRYRLGDLVVHAWDIATAAQLVTDLDQEVVEELWRRVAPHLEEMRSMGSYGPGASGTLPPDASVVDRLLDAFGRHL